MKTRSKRKQKATPRQPNEFYPTPPELAYAITSRVAEVVGSVNYIVEPSAGSGSFVRALRHTYPHVPMAAVDVRPEARQQCLDAGATGFYQEDWLEHLRIEGGLPDHTLVIGNPPYRSGAGPKGDLATSHVLAALAHLPTASHLAFLLPLSHFGGQDRGRRLWARPGLLAWFQLPQRPSFIGDGNANSEYAVFIWRAGFQGRAVLLDPLWLTERRQGHQ